MQMIRLLSKNAWTTALQVDCSRSFPVLSNPRVICPTAACHNVVCTPSQCRWLEMLVLQAVVLEMLVDTSRCQKLHVHWPFPPVAMLMPRLAPPACCWCPRADKTQLHSATSLHSVNAVWLTLHAAGAAAAIKGCRKNSRAHDDP
jgi:hypothetical protein